MVSSVSFGVQWVVPNRFGLQVCWKGRLAKHLLVRFGVQAFMHYVGYLERAHQQGMRWFLTDNGS